MIESSLWAILPNLSIGVISVIALVYITLKNNEQRSSTEDSFLSHLDERTRRHEDSMFERETALRTLESEVRTQVMNQLSENTRVLERAINHMDKH